MAELGFDGRVALITGAGGGLGRQHALLLASRGAQLVINDLGGSVSGEGGDAGAADRTAKEINELGGDAVADSHSVTTPEGGEAIVATALWGTMARGVAGRSSVSLWALAQGALEGSGLPVARTWPRRTGQSDRGRSRGL